MSELSAPSLRADVWLWRARFFKSRSAAAKLIEEGRVRHCAGGIETRLDKPARLLRLGDSLVFASGERLIAVLVAGLGVRRGPPAEARTLYTPLGCGDS